MCRISFFALVSLSTGPHNRRPTQRGFSLAEVLTAIAIITVLIVAAVPSYMWMRNRTLMAVTQDEVHRGVRNVQAHRMEKHGFPSAMLVSQTQKDDDSGNVLWISPNPDVDLFYTRQGQGFCIAGIHRRLETPTPHYVYNSQAKNSEDATGCGFPTDFASAPAIIPPTTPPASPAPPPPASNSGDNGDNQSPVASNPPTNSTPSPSPAPQAPPPTQVVPQAESWRVSERSNVTKISAVDENGGFVANQGTSPEQRGVREDGVILRLTTSEPSLLTGVPPSTEGVFTLNGVTSHPRDPNSTSGGFAIAIHGQGESHNFSGYTIQIDRGFGADKGGSVVLREWSNGVEGSRPIATASLPTGFDFSTPNNISVALSNGGTTASLKINDTPYQFDGLQAAEGHFGVRTWGGRTLDVKSSSIEVP